MAGTLERLANEARAARGADYALAAKSLRYYINSAGRPALLADVALMTDEGCVRYLFGAGLPQWLHDAVVDRVKELRA